MAAAAPPAPTSSTLAPAKPTPEDAPSPLPGCRGHYRRDFAYYDLLPSIHLDLVLADVGRGVKHDGNSGGVPTLAWYTLLIR